MTYLIFTLCFVNVVYHIDIWMLNQSCNPGVIPTWSWCVILLLFCWIWFLDILWRIFALCSSRILACNRLFLCGIVACFWCQSNVGLVKWVWKSFLLFYFLCSLWSFFFWVWILWGCISPSPTPLTPPVCPQVSLVLSALQAGNKGTQACITAATAVSGIIADLDTTIMFATAGTLNAENNETFADHRYGGDSHPGGSWTGRRSLWPDGLWRCCPTSRNMVMRFYFERMFKWGKWTT